MARKQNNETYVSASVPVRNCVIGPGLTFLVKKSPMNLMKVYIKAKLLEKPMTQESDTSSIHDLRKIMTDLATRKNWKRPSMYALTFNDKKMITCEMSYGRCPWRYPERRKIMKMV